MATLKDTLTAYTQALNTIATQTFDAGQLMAFTFRADEPTCTIGIKGYFEPGIIEGHVYGITVYGMADTIYAKLVRLDATVKGDVLTFKRLTPDAQGIVKAVLAERETAATAPSGRYSMPFTVTWDRHSPFPVWTYGDAPLWRKGEGNNP